MINSMSERNGYLPFSQLLEEISRAQDCGATIAALAMSFVCIDTMALLSCPVGQVEQTKGDFIEWVNMYLKADQDSDYHYSGIDVYAARCALLHCYGSEAKIHITSKGAYKFVYIDNGPHKVDTEERLALISVAVFIKDLSGAVYSFMSNAREDKDLKNRIDSRIANLFVVHFLS